MASNKGISSFEMETPDSVRSSSSTTVGNGGGADTSLDFGDLIPCCGCCCCLFAPDSICFPLECSCQLAGIAAKVSLCEILKICFQCCEIQQCCGIDTCTCCSFEDGRCCQCKGGAHFCSCSVFPTCCGCRCCTCCASIPPDEPTSELTGPSMPVEAPRLPKFVPPKVSGHCMQISCCPWLKDCVYGCSCGQMCCGLSLFSAEHGCPCSTCCIISCSGFGCRVLSGSAVPCIMNVLGFTLCFQFKCATACCSRIQTLVNKTYQPV